jgi:hypothetical protein
MLLGIGVSVAGVAASIAVMTFAEFAATATPVTFPPKAFSRTVRRLR